MRNSTGDLARLQHILDAISEIELYLTTSSFDVFMENSMMRYACIKQMEIIGEACTHITNETKNKFTSIEWAQIIGMRNVFVHEYFGIDSSLVWEIIKKDLPILKKQVIEIIDSL